jgi:hypothetical protein
MSLTVADHPQHEEICQLLKSGLRGAEISDWLVENGHQPLRRQQINDYFYRHFKDDGDGATVTIEGDVEDVEGQILEAKALIRQAREHGLRAKTVRVEAGSSVWDGWTRDDDGELPSPATQEAVRRKVTLTVSEDPQLEERFEIRQAQPVNVRWKVQKPKSDSDWKWAVIIPDAQRPFDDPQAVDVVLQILTDVQAQHGVDRIVHLGDDLDLPDFGKHRTAPDALGSLQAAIDDQHRVLAIERAICPDAQIDWLAGNHEQRLTNWLVDNGPQLIGLRRADSAHEDPVLSVPYLCRLRELDVNFVDPYPEGEVWLNSHFRAIHGEITKGAKGATAAAHLGRGDVSTVYGHIHRSELLYQTRHTFAGPRTYLAGSPGCLCDLSGSVPSTRSGITPDGNQGMRRTEDWQNGIWIVSYQDTGRELYVVEPVQIWGGWAMFRGKQYQARTTQ